MLNTKRDVIETALGTANLGISSAITDQNALKNALQVAAKALETRTNSTYASLNVQNAKQQSNPEQGNRLRR